MKIPEDNQPEFLNGWLQAFQERYNFHHFRLHGESGSADLEAIELNLPNIIRKTDKYSLRNIYNIDETGLFYSMTPDRAKKDCIRLTIALTSNADGTHKLWPFIIGHVNKPRCFKKKTGEQLGFYYRNNQRA
ncbi:3014_t:CDS:2 [Dentiscutata heterogama]|uniref:3014_t:CDS:1 n=1 Tax=Dentiscutata heterogama TaxID=1316150 RepID=A0ACA9MAI9_9GLOM|nr:3014_t:CDS:2 [Dentiscutata heterogama]